MSRNPISINTLPPFLWNKRLSSSSPKRRRLLSCGGIGLLCSTQAMENKYNPKNIPLSPWCPKERLSDYMPGLRTLGEQCDARGRSFKSSSTSCFQRRIPACLLLRGAYPPKDGCCSSMSVCKNYVPGRTLAEASEYALSFLML